MDLLCETCSPYALFNFICFFKGKMNILKSGGVQKDSHELHHEHAKSLKEKNSNT